MTGVQTCALPISAIRVKTGYVTQLQSAIAKRQIDFEELSVDVQDAAIGKRDQVTIFGNDYETNDGTCIRDYIHVVDLAKSHVSAMDFILNNAGKHAFNIGTGIGISVLDLIKIFEKANNIRVNYTIGNRRKGDVEQIYANVSLAKVQLGWEARETLQQAMTSSLEWEKQKATDV